MTKTNPLSKASTPDAALPQIDVEAEREKAAGQTDAQKADAAYYKGKFQTHDPVTGEKRDKPLS